MVLPDIYFDSSLWTGLYSNTKQLYCSPKIFRWVKFFLKWKHNTNFPNKPEQYPTANTDYAQSLKILLIYYLLVNNCRYKINLLYKSHFLLTHT